MQVMLTKPHYGYDAPEIVKRFGLYGTISLLITLLFVVFLPNSWISIFAKLAMLFLTISLLMPAITILLGSLYFKFRERDWLFNHLSLKGHENILTVVMVKGVSSFRHSGFSFLLFEENCNSRSRWATQYHLQMERFLFCSGRSRSNLRCGRSHTL